MRLSLIHILFLTEHQTLELKEESTLKDTRYDLLLVIANQGYTDVYKRQAFLLTPSRCWPE